MSEKKAKPHQWTDQSGDNYQVLENVYAVVGKRADGGDALCAMMGSGFVVSDTVKPLMRKIAGQMAEMAESPVYIVRFVRAEVVEVFEP